MEKLLVGIDEQENETHSLLSFSTTSQPVTHNFYNLSIEIQTLLSKWQREQVLSMDVGLFLQVMKINSLRKDSLHTHSKMHSYKLSSLDICSVHSVNV